MNDKLGPIQYLRDILIEEMDLDDDRVLVYNQKINLPTDDGLFVVVEFKHAKPFSARSSWTTDNPPQEVQEVNMQEFYTIGVFSRSLEALQRKHEVYMAFASQYSQQVQEEQSFKISRCLPFQDLSPLEETALLYRFDIEVVVLAWYEKKKTLDYYDSYTGSAVLDPSDLKETFTQPTTEIFP